MEGNLTKGPILKTLTKLAIPIMASSFLGTLYNITDMAWIGLLGAKAVAGVGVGGMFTWLSQGLVSLARMGGQVQVASILAGENRKKHHGYAQAAVQMSALLGILFAAVVLILLKTTDRIFQAGGCRGVGGSFFLYKNCLWADYVFLFVIDADRTLYSAGRF